MRILGIDPGSRLTGYGCVDVIGNQIRHVTHGTLKLASTSGRATIPLEQRLLAIHEGLSKVILEHKPTVMSIERVFFAKNAVSVLMLGQARGAAILCGAIHSLNIVEYSPTEVKASLVGHGGADKEQVAKMVQLLLGKLEFATFDASDGLALAICHAHAMSSSNANRPAATTTLNSTRKKKMTLAESLGITPEMVVGKRRISVPEKN
ncbi:MAG: crossover junction endodeoxyribonuclease RuvC [Methylotenera sp.]|nr:crossover junction endodeoxyribonuclease RuvC [Oligoflexia bacterium]